MQGKDINSRQGNEVQKPDIHFGTVASGDVVMKSGEERDRIAKRDKVIAFEMEGAGVWDNLPCIIIKGVCDYADSHKNKKWQSFAAATSASAMKALLERYIRTDRPSRQTVPHGRFHNGPIYPFHIIFRLFQDIL
jgi:nucleoside phosphorylase